jgi:putative oxidoreductase
MSCTNLIRPYPETARTLQRLICGLFFFPHTIYKLLGLPAAYALFTKMGFPVPELFVWLAIVAEAIAAIGLTFNLYPRWTGLIGAGALLGAAAGICSAKGGFGWLWNLGGIEYTIFWAVSCICVALTAPSSPKK